MSYLLNDGEANIKTAPLVSDSEVGKHFDHLITDDAGPSQVGSLYLNMTVEKALQGFSCVHTKYRCESSTVVAALTDLLKNHGFVWPLFCLHHVWMKTLQAPGGC